MSAEIIFHTGTDTESGPFVQSIRAAITEQADTGFHIPRKALFYGLKLNVYVGSNIYLFAFHTYMVHYEPLCRSGCFCYYELAVYIRHGTDIGSFDNDGGTDGRLAVTNYDSTRYALSLCKDHYTA